MAGIWLFSLLRLRIWKSWHIYIWMATLSCQREEGNKINGWTDSYRSIKRPHATSYIWHSAEEVGWRQCRAEITRVRTSFDQFLVFVLHRNHRITFYGLIYFRPYGDPPATGLFNYVSWWFKRKKKKEKAIQCLILSIYLSSPWDKFLFHAKSFRASSILQGFFFCWKAARSPHDFGVEWLNYGLRCMTKKIRQLHIPFATFLNLFDFSKVPRLFVAKKLSLP